MAEPKEIQSAAMVHERAHTASTASAMKTSGKTTRSRIRRHPERSVPEMAEEILLRGRVAHVAFALDGQPYIIPTTYHYEDATVYIHGAPASRMVKALRAGTPVCVEVTLLDGLVASRDAKSHSANYRSAIVFGVATPVTDLATKRALLERMTLRYFPGRTAGQDYLSARDGDLRAVELLAIAIDEQSAKARFGGPKGAHDVDEEGPFTRYVLPLPGVDA
jgi:nitroimidazol reductase NimA-like FMN-containing flavoprotein (pyridoxamine 5'-phosphate oxidase superfamily)